MKQMEFKMQRKEEVFYVRCRLSVKQALLMQMEKDGFESMADWFEQFVTKSLSKPKKAKKK